MKQLFAPLRWFAAVFFLFTLLSGAALAAELPADSEYVFDGTEFGEDAAACGIYVAQAPDEDACGLFYGTRRICAGDFLPAQALSQLVLRPCRDEDAEVCICYCPIVDGALSDECQLTMKIASTRNDPPTAQDGKLQTYKNIANTGTLCASDPEGEALQFQIVRQPKRGKVELGEDGSFVYTPDRNKVGKDSFSFTASDPAGNVSEEHTIEIEILKPADAATFSDLDAQSQFLAVWMRSNGLYGGETVAQQLCFCPEKAVTRGEFLVMAMKQANIPPELGLLSSGFADQADAPRWMQSYLVSAMRRGIVSGIPTPDDLQFMPNRIITAPEAASILCNILHLEKSQAVSNDDTSLPAWAAGSLQAAALAGLTLPEDNDDLTRLEAARLLYSAME